MLQGREEPGLRWGLVREALSILDGAVAANPGSAEALRNRGRYTVLKVVAEPDLAARFAAARRRTAAEAAFDDLRAALDLDPSDAETAGALPLAAWPVGLDRVRAGRWEEAAGALRAAVRAYDRVLADAREELGDEIASEGPARAAFEGILAARERAAAVLTACEAPADARPAALESVRERFVPRPFPGVRDSARSRA
jgi:tetratricopeptide (TPR) repeat protein